MTATKRKRVSSPPSPARPADFKDNLTSVIAVTTRGAEAIDAKTIAIHTSLLKQKSAYLYQLASRTSSRELKLLDLDSDAFAIFAAWVYGSPITFDTHTQSSHTAGDPGDILQSVLDCYILSLNIKVLDFGNAILSRARAISVDHGIVFRNEVISAIYTATKADEPDYGCLLRKWIVHEWVWQFDGENVALLDWQECGELNKEFLFDVMRVQALRLGAKAKKHQSPSVKPESYHH